MDTLTDLMGAGAARVPHMTEHKDLEALSVKTIKQCSGSDYRELLKGAQSILLGNKDKVNTITPLLDESIAQKDIAIFAIKDVDIPSEGLTITTTEDGPNLVLLITENLTDGDINVSPLLALTVNADNIVGS